MAMGSRRGFVNKPPEHDSDTIPASPFNQSNAGQFGARDIRHGMLQAEGMGYVQTPFRRLEDGTSKGGEIFAVREACEHWAFSMQSTDCRFSCGWSEELKSL